MGSRRPTSDSFQRRLKAQSTPISRRNTRIRWLRHSDFWLWAQLVAMIMGIFLFPPAIYMYWIDLKDRKTQRITQAWELVSRDAPGNSGKGPALEYLNENSIPLVGINLSTHTYATGTYLKEVNLSKANLQEATLSGVILDDANLSRADLSNADLSDASLRSANLTNARLMSATLSESHLAHAVLKGANLEWADLSNAYLMNSDLFHAKLNHANLSGALMAGAKNLRQSQLDSACGDNTTTLPIGLTVKDCSQQLKPQSAIR